MATFFGNNSDDNILGSDSDDIIYGYAGNDTLRGNDGNDVLYGADGNDVLDGGMGVDFLDGGTGVDTFIIRNVGDKIKYYSSNPDEDIIVFSDSYSTQSWDIEYIYNNFLGNGVFDIYYSNRGHFDGIKQIFLNNTDITSIFKNNYTGYNEFDVSEKYYDGTDGDDIIVGFSGDDRLGTTSGLGSDTFFGFTGNDTLYGNSGDKLFGGVGNDIYRLFSLGNEVIEYALEGLDTVYFYDGTVNQFTLQSNVERLILVNDTTQIVRGNSDDNYLNLNISNNYVLGGDGADEILGRRGDDRIYSGNDSDKVYGGADNDVIFGESGNDRLLGEFGNDHLLGGDGNDTLLGGIGGDRIYGGTGDDYINAGSAGDLIRSGDGNDYLNGGSGDDNLFGGLGSDTFVFEADQFSWCGTDTIFDYEDNIDKIDISSLLDAIGYTGNNAISDGYVNYINNEGNVEVFLDTTGGGGLNNHFATLIGIDSSSISYNDFIM